MFCPTGRGDKAKLKIKDFAVQWPVDFMSNFSAGSNCDKFAYNYHGSAVPNLFKYNKRPNECTAYL